MAALGLPACTGLARAAASGGRCSAAPAARHRIAAAAALLPYGKRAVGAVARSIGAAPAARRATVVQMQWLCAGAAANESSGCTAVVMRVKALAARHRKGRRGSKAPMRAARRPAAVSPCLCSVRLSSFFLLSLAAGSLTLPLLWGIDRRRAYYGTTYARTPSFSKPMFIFHNSI